MKIILLNFLKFFLIVTIPKIVTIIIWKLIFNYFFSHDIGGYILILIGTPLIYISVSTILIYYSFLYFKLNNSSYSRMLIIIAGLFSDIIIYIVIPWYLDQILILSSLFILNSIILIIILHRAQNKMRLHSMT